MAAGGISFDAGTGIVLVEGGPGNDRLDVASVAGGEIRFSLALGASVINQRYGAAQVRGITFLADAGNDQFFNMSDVPALAYGGPGNDRIESRSARAEFYGDADDDLLMGGSDDDRLDGGGGKDSLRGGDGRDILVGGDGDDDLRGSSGDDLLYGDGGNDRLNGDNDNDILFGGTGSDTLLGSAGNDQLRGGPDDDLLMGSAGRDSLFGEEGDDQLVAGGGNDLLWGGAGDDSLKGESGNDALLGEGGADRLRGGTGGDLLIGGAGADFLYGEADADVLIGATTAYDNQADSLRLIVDIINSRLSYATRIGSLENPASSLRLRSTETVFDDAIPDELSGSAGEDWFFLTGELPTGHVDDHDHGAATLSDPGPVFGDDPPPTIAEIRARLDRIVDHEEGEAIHTRIPHATNPTLQAEHFAFLALAELAEITHASVGSGPWSDPATWHDGQIPVAGANVLISPGTIVTVDGQIAEAPRRVRIEGTLRFDPTRDTSLLVDTLIGLGTGRLEMGTAAEPIPAEHSARLVIADLGPIDRGLDPLALSRGVILHGSASLHGAETTGFLELAAQPRLGDTTLLLASAPTNWRVGDRIVVAGTNPKANEDEERTILAINGAAVSIEPLAFDHPTPRADLVSHVVHLTRNVSIESQSAELDRRGHVMFMHTRNVDVRYAGFYRLGRTNKLLPVDDPVLTDDGGLVAGTGTNPRGRYAVHFHRNGTSRNTPPAIVQGSVVEESPSWGYASHSSYVDFTDNVAYRATGAAFMTEAGDEVGAMRRNMALRTGGSDELPAGRDTLQDFGHQGDGFWLQGAGVAVEDNVAAGSHGHGIIFFTRELIEAGLGAARFLSANLPDPSLAGGEETFRVNDVPIHDFRRNEVYASDNGVRIHGGLQFATHNDWSVAEDLLLWNNLLGLSPRYTRQMIFRNVDIVGVPGLPNGEGVSPNNISGNLVFENLSVVNYIDGLVMPRRGNRNAVVGGYFNNVRNILVDTPLEANYALRIEGNIGFGTLPPEVLFQRTQYEVVMRADFTPFEDSLAHVFAPFTVELNYGRFVHKRAYFREQDANFIPFPQAVPGIPRPYVGLTNRQLWNFHRVAIGGALAPPTALPWDRIDGLVN